MGWPSSSVTRTSLEVCWLQSLLRFLLHPLKFSCYCFERCCCYCLLLFIHCYSDFSPISFFSLLHAWNVLNLLWRNLLLPYFSKPIIFHASVVLCLGSLTAFALHSVFIHNKNAGLLWPVLPSYTDFCIYFRILCFSFLASICKDKIRPPIPLPNLTLMSGWLTFLSLVLLAFIPQPHCPPD